MTVEEYMIYSDKAREIFAYLNGRVNILNNNCVLSTDCYDYANRTYGNIVFPSNIIVHVGNIVDEWDIQYTKYFTKHDFICTLIAWTIAHELHHADQDISMIKYNKDEQYRKSIEQDVEKTSYDWVDMHSAEISSACGFNVVIKMLTSNSFVDFSNYTRAGTKAYYLQTIANVVIRDIDYFFGLHVFTNDNMCSDMIIVFNDTDSVVIKSNDNFLRENIGLFSSLVAKYCTIYNKYNIGIDISFGTNSMNRRTATVNFNISNGVIVPLVLLNK